jgi:branched-chain amino acid transport system substrate-binding protein
MAAGFITGAGSQTRRRFAQIAAVGTAALLAPSVIGRAAPAVIRLGQIESLTGPSSPAGIRGRDGTELVLAELNRNGIEIGGAPYKIEITVGDLANDARQAITLLRQYAATDMLCSIGPTNSVGYVPIVPVAGQLNFAIVGDGSVAPIKAWNPYAYRVNPTSAVGTPILLRQVVAREKITRLAVLYDQTQDGQRADSETCKEMAGPFGYEIVAFQAFRTGDPDFSPQISTIRAARPNAIFLAAAPGDGIKMAPQIRDAGIEVPLLTGSGSFQDPVYWNGTKGQINGCYTWISLDLQAPSPGMKSFIDAYRAAHDGQVPASSCTFGADALYAVAAALKTAGKVERGAFAEALAALDTVTPLGTHVHFKNPPNGDNLDPAVLAIQINGPGTYVRI